MANTEKTNPISAASDERDGALVGGPGFISIEQHNNIVADLHRRLADQTELAVGYNSHLDDISEVVDRRPGEAVIDAVRRATGEYRRQIEETIGLLKEAFRSGALPEELHHRIGRVPIPFTTTPADEPGESRAKEWLAAPGTEDVIREAIERGKETVAALDKARQFPAHQPQASESPKCMECGDVGFRWDRQICATVICDCDIAIRGKKPAPQPATVTPPTRDLAHAITLIGDAVYKICNEHAVGGDGGPRILQAKRFINEAQQILSRLESRADSDGEG